MTPWCEEELAAIARDEAGVYAMTEAETAAWVLRGARPAAPCSHPTLGPVVTADPIKLGPGLFIVRWWKP